MARPDVKAFFDENTFTISYAVSDPATRRAAIIDSVLDFDQASGRTSRRSADLVLAHIRDRGLVVDWIMETHVHADHLSAAPYLKEAAGGEVVIGERIADVQKAFAETFNAEPSFRRDGGQFDRLLRDGDVLPLGELEIRAMHTPGHTPACMTYVIGDAAFVGDTLFMPDFGTARTDFPGGDARMLYRSIRKVLALPPATRLFMCHDYKAPGRDHYAWETTVADERERNIHVRDGVDEDAFVRMREERDAKLGMPKLILPSVQVNIRAGRMPPAEDNGVTYLKVPIDLL